MRDAARYGDVSQVQRVIEAGRWSCEDMTVALFYALQYSLPDTARLTVVGGADIHAKNEQGETAIDVARRRKYRILESDLACLQAVTDASTEHKIGQPSTQEASHLRTPLESSPSCEGTSEHTQRAHISACFISLEKAILSRTLEKVKEIISDQKDAIHIKDVDCQTAFHIAASVGDKDIMEVLLQHMPHKDILDAKNSEGESALLIAVRQDRKEVAEMLAAAGADTTEVRRLVAKKPSHWAGF